MSMFIPHSEEEIREMLETLGKKSLAELFLTIPEDLKIEVKEEKIQVLKEAEVRKELKRIANYLEVLAEKSSIETMAKWGKMIKIKKEE